MPAAAANYHRGRQRGGDESTFSARKGRDGSISPRFSSLGRRENRSVPSLVDGVEGARLLDGVALNEVDAEIAQRFERRLVLDLLGDYLEIERARELDHRGDHLSIDAIRLEIASVYAVDLEVVER